jgi:hypothetical protein
MTMTSSSCSRRDVLRAGVAVAGGTAVAATVGSVGLGSAAFAETAAAALPGVPLPIGFAPEGIEIGRCGTAYVTNRVNGSIYRVSLTTSAGSVFSAGPGTPSLGPKHDTGHRHHDLRHRLGRQALTTPPEKRAGKRGASAGEPQGGEGAERQRGNP